MDNKALLGTFCGGVIINSQCNFVQFVFWVHSCEKSPKNSLFGFSVAEHQDGPENLWMVL